MTASYLPQILLVSALALNGVNDEACAADLIGYYSFEGNFEDSSGNGNHAEKLGAVEFTDTGFRGKGLNFENGGNQTKVDLPIDGNPSASEEITWGGWANVRDNGFNGFMSIDNGAWDRGIVHGYQGGGWGIASGASAYEVADVTLGEWQFVVGTFDLANDRATLYVGDDDPLNFTTASDSTADAGDDPGEPTIEIGLYDNQDFDGLIDDAFVFDTALSDFEVNAIRNLRLSVFDYSPVEVAALFDLFEKGEAGLVGGETWEPATGLDARVPGALIDAGDKLGLALSANGNGLVSQDLFVPTDSDGDDMGDYWETVFFENLSRDGSGDFDDDGLTDLEEWRLRLKPDDVDFDGDGLKDGEEVAAGTNPKSSDTDGDGLADGAEVNAHKTDPKNPDTDGDQFTDGREVLEGSDPADPGDFPRPDTVVLLGYYPFDGDYADASGNGNDAEPLGEVDFTADGFRGDGLEFDDGGPQTKVDLPINANPKESDMISWGGWANVDARGFDGFMSIDNGSWDRGIYHSHDGSNWGIGSGVGSPANSTAAAVEGEWQFVVGTFNKSENRAVLYVGDDDPGESTTVVHSKADAGVDPGEPTIEIGLYDNQDFNGRVDDAFVFQGELNAYEVNAIRNLRLSALDLSPKDAAELISLFANNERGVVNGLSWSPISGLAAEVPGSVVDAGPGFTVVLDEAGDGMMSGRPRRFEITTIERTSDPQIGMTLGWTSRSGRVYSVESSGDLINWTDLVSGLHPTGEQTTYVDRSAEVAADTRRFYRIREDLPPPLFAEDFESGAPGWTVGTISEFSETGTRWEVGAPSNGPGAAFSGENVYGTDLDANYEDGTGIFLRTPVIDLTGAGRAKLIFWHAMSAVEGEGGRLNLLEADGTPILTGLKLYVAPEANRDTWTQESIRLPDLDRPAIIEFELLAGDDDDLGNRPGWFIDDVVVD